jgi:uncharacterized RDD family membrane protein YckC
MSRGLSRRAFALLLAVLFAIATALVVLIAYLVAELYLSSKGWLIELPDGQVLAHLRMRNLLLLIAVPVMAGIGFAVGWASHVSPERPDALAPTSSRPAGATGQQPPGR